MTFRYGVLAVLTFVSLLIGACSRPAATVDGKGISRETLDLHLREKMQQHNLQKAAVDEKKLRYAVLQELIGERLTLNEAAKRGITVTDAELSAGIDSIRKRLGDEQYQKSLKDKGLTPESFAQRTREKMIMGRFVDSFVKESDITEQEMNDHYKNSQKPFIKPMRVHMKIVEFQTEEAARAAVDEMKKTKADFDAYAAKLSEEKKAMVTDYGWVTPEFFSAEMASSVKMLKTGQQGGPYKGRQGFYLVRVKDRQDEGIATYDEVKDTIRGTLLSQKRSDAYMQWMEQKRNSAKIVINLK